MIDTDKYEGHTQGPWKAGGYNIQAIKVWTVDGFDEDDNWIHAPRVDQLLALDAPLLLAEVKRLREEIKRIAGITNGYVGPTKAWAEHITKDLLAVIE